MVWRKSDVNFHDRYDKYLDPSFFQHRIHWFSIFNSFMMVIFLVGLVSMILMRTLRKDYARYSKVIMIFSGNKSTIQTYEFKTTIFLNFNKDFSRKKNLMILNVIWVMSTAGNKFMVMCLDQRHNACYSAPLLGPALRLDLIGLRLKYCIWIENRRIKSSFLNRHSN